jgi:hypothetical protein
MVCTKQGMTPSTYYYMVSELVPLKHIYRLSAMGPLAGLVYVLI